MPTQSLAATALQTAKSRLVGRDDEIALLERAVRAASGRPLIMTLTGPPGVGKTALALVAHLSALLEKRHSVFFSAAQAGPAPPGIRLALAEHDLAGGFAELGHGEERTVLVVDGFEHILSSGSWFFSELLTHAGSNLTLLVTSRMSLGAVLAPFQALLEVVEIELSNLGRRASEQLLEQAGIEAAFHQRAFELTQGHPLALCLLMRDPEALKSETAGQELPEGLVLSLAASFVSDLSNQQERDALSALVVVRACNERMLAQLLKREDVGSIYDWLRTLSYVQETTHGLAPHDLLREVVHRDLQRRDPDRLANLESSAACEYLARMDGLDPNQQWPLFIDALYALRSRPSVQSTFGSETLRTLWMERASPQDLRWAKSQVERFEGKKVARAFEYYTSLEGRAFVVRDGGSEPVGFQHWLAATTQIDSRFPDEVLAKALAWARSKVERRPLEPFTCRWWFARRTYQQFSADLSALVSMSPLITGTTGPPILAGTHVTVGIEAWENFAAYTPTELLEQATLDGRGYGIWSLDPIATAPTNSPNNVVSSAYPFWLSMLSGVPNDSAYGLPPSRSKVTDDSLREALTVFHAAHRLEQCVLAQCFPSEDRVSRCRAWFIQGIEQMATSPAHADLASLLEATYIRPAVKQQAAASELGLPWGTYRHRLKRAVEVLAAELSRTERADATDERVIAARSHP